MEETMFPHTVTIYNVATEIDKATLKDVTVNHITVLKGVLLDETKAANVRASGLESADSADLYIPFNVNAVDGVTGEKKQYLSPAEFWKLSDKTGYWTLAISSKKQDVDGSTFFVKGNVVEPDMTVQDINLKYDNVFNITKVDEKDFGGGMAHWEVGGN